MGHLVPLQGARGWKRQSSESIVSSSFLLLVLFYCAKHKATETKNEKQIKKKHKAPENSTPNKVKTQLLRLDEDGWLVSLRLGERK